MTGINGKKCKKTKQNKTKQNKTKQNKTKQNENGRNCCTYPYDHVCVYRQPNSEWKSNYRTNSRNNNMPGVIT